MTIQVNQAALKARTTPADTLAMDDLAATVKEVNEEAERIRNETEVLVALGKAQAALAEARAERDELLSPSNEPEPGTVTPVPAPRRRISPWVYTPALIVVAYLTITGLVLL